MGLLSKLFSGRPTVTPTHVEDLDGFRREVLESDLPVLVNVWSPTCAPCRRLAPVLSKVADRYADRVRVAEVSATSDRALLGRLGVRGTPTTVVFDGGQEIGRVVGFRPMQWFEEMIEAELSGGDEAAS